MVARVNYRTTPEAVQLYHEGQLAHSVVESAGVRVDKGYLDAALADTAVRIHAIEEELRADPIYARWRRRFGEKTKLSAPDQLAWVIYNDLGYVAKSTTASGKRGKVDEASFEGVDLPFVKQYFKAQKLRKARGTYLIGIQREMVYHDGEGWFVHPSYNLNTVATYRSSCDNPNWQNIPTRNEMMAEMVRRCYIPRAGHQLVEIDYSQIEVRIAACYNHDPNLIAYILDPTTDMHRDVACKLFFLAQKEVNKASRHLAKNKYVFPEFYGDFYPRCAKNCWDAIEFQNIKVGADADGPSLFDRLRENGITSLGACDPGVRPAAGTFEHHVKEIEDWFWNVRFPVYTAWKKKWYAEYLRTGGFAMHSGFAVNGRYSRNEVINYPIQGAAFHCLLWSLIRIVKNLRRLKMKTRVVGQIHDCIVADVHPAERDAYVQMARQVMVEEIAKAWKWLIVPLEVEPEVCPVDGNWFGKMACTFDGDGRVVPADKKKWDKRHGDWREHFLGAQ